MREPRKGERCEYKQISVDNINGETCQERHLHPGVVIKGPVSLVPCKEGKAVKLLCQRHAPQFPGIPTKRLKRAPGRTNAVQENLL